MPRPRIWTTVSMASVVVGTSVAVYNMFVWGRYQYFFAQARPTSSVLWFYAAMAVSVFLLLVGFYLATLHLRKMGSVSNSSPLAAIIGAALSDKKLVRAGILGTAAYGVLYAFTSSIVVFQPGVDFLATYGAVGAASWAAFPCCGTPGTFPELVVYLAPVHLAIQLVPLSLLLFFIVPPLVGLNLAIAIFSVSRTVAKITGRWAVACGAAVGLFTACPTCAGFFLAESVGGLGATTLAVALAPYQALFIAVSIPLLLSMPLLFAARVRRAAVAGPLGTDARPILTSGNR